MKKGYKVFNSDWTCRGFQFEIGKTYEENVDLKCCERGFHFCNKLVDCFDYYKFDPENKVAEIVAEGDVVSEGNKSCTNKIKIVKELSWHEVLDLVNVGKDNTGNRNTGNWNTGDWNTGDWNTGDWNTGDWNTGDWNTGNCNTGNRNTGNWNTGDWNTGDRNTGNCNTGNCNTGNRNTGDWNTGDWNKSSHNTGCFNTKEHTIYMFNKPSNLKYQDWLNSRAKFILDRMPSDCVAWIESSNMTEEEKAQNPTHETTGGFLKHFYGSKNRQTWWNGLSEEDKTEVKSLPNFDSEIFKEITGIDVN